DPSAHAATWLRLCPGERGPRHSVAPSLARAQEYPAHGALHGAGARPLQELLALDRGLLRPVRQRRQKYHKPRMPRRREGTGVWIIPSHARVTPIIYFGVTMCHGTTASSRINPDSLPRRAAIKRESGQP